MDIFSGEIFLYLPLGARNHATNAHVCYVLQISRYLLYNQFQMSRQLREIWADVYVCYICCVCV